MGEERVHTLSPSAWNRYETCPRMYWLSRQRLPRKAGMAASLERYTPPIEDLLQADLSGRDSSETHWLPEMAEKFLKQRWEEEKEIFFATQGGQCGKKKNGTKRRECRGGNQDAEFVGAVGVTPLETTVELEEFIVKSNRGFEG